MPRTRKFKVKTSTQLGQILNLMDDGRFRTLGEIALYVGAPETSVSARLRDLRKPEFGSFTVLRRAKKGTGTRMVFEYQVAEAKKVRSKNKYPF